jgi:hypothetical protein
MGQNRSHTVKATEISADSTPAFTFEFAVFRTSTFVILKDAAGSVVGHFDITCGDWDELVAHSNRVRSADREQA